MRFPRPIPFTVLVAIGALAAVALAMTARRGKGDYHGDLKAIRAANTEDPHRKIYEGPAAVRRPAAS